MEVTFAVAEGKPFMTVQGGRMTLNVGAKPIPLAVQVDASKSPRAIDMTYVGDFRKGQRNSGVYEVTGDDLRICYVGAGKDRPTDFTAGEGSGRTLMTLKRVKK